MGTQRGDQAARRGRTRGRRALRIGLLAGVLTGLLVFVLVNGSSQTRTFASCTGGAGAPEVPRVPPGDLSRLRDDLARVAPQRIARLYEEGAVTAQSAWTDELPQPPSVSPTALRPDAYEMRWWAPNGDDLVADELVFANAATAGRFLQKASSPHCRGSSVRFAASSPPRGLDLSWVNPDGAAQADVLFARGSRVFRVADAPAAQRGGVLRHGSLSRSFALVDALACLLPGARCVQEPPGGIAS